MHVTLIFNIDNIEIIIRSEVSNSVFKVSLSHIVGFLLIDVSGVMQISPTFLFMKNDEGITMVRARKGDRDDEDKGRGSR